MSGRDAIRFLVREAHRGIPADAAAVALLSSQRSRGGLTRRSSELPGAGDSPAVDVVIETFAFLSALPRLIGSRSPWIR